MRLFTADRRITEERLAAQEITPPATFRASVLATISAMPIAVMTVIVSMGSVVPSLVLIDIEQAIPTHMNIITVSTTTVPTMKIGVATQPIRIMMAVSDDVVLVVSFAMTSMC